MAVNVLSCEEKNSSTNDNDANTHLKENLIGKWGGPRENLIWEIRKDSVFNFGDSSLFPYKLNEDTLIFFNNGLSKPTVIGKISIIIDTLFITTTDSFLVKSYRNTGQKN